MSGDPAGPVARFLRSLLRWIFYHLYHSLAWTYDGVANTVSLGRWFVWIDSVIPFIQGTHVLELGHGTGHLQSRLAGTHGLTSFGLDESRQMAGFTVRRARAAGQAAPKLVRAIVHSMPFESSTFDSVVATFPTEFIFQVTSLREIHRLLKVDGRLVVLPVAWLLGRGFFEQAAAWLIAFTRQVPPSPEDWVRARLAQPLRSAGFQVDVHRINSLQSIALVVVATKMP